MSRLRQTQFAHRSPLALVVAAGPIAASGHPGVAEVIALLEGLGFETAAVVRQRRPPDSPTGLGPGKVDEIRAFIDRVEGETGVRPEVVVTGELDPGRLGALSRRLDVAVLDRTEVILRIFQARAETPLAHTEIEIARLRHLLPRVRERAGQSDRQGGGGRGGRGHSNVVLGKQAIQERIAELERRRAKLRREIDLRIAARSETPKVALVGYTNAGKSSWMRALTGASVESKDALFHTLGTRVRALGNNPGPRILVADTVGFLEGLPHALLAAFHSTLHEAIEADLWVHVADASSAHVHRQIEATERTLREVARETRPGLLLLNKSERLDGASKAALRERYPEALLVSSLSGDDREAVAARVRQFAEGELRTGR